MNADRLTMQAAMHGNVEAQRRIAALGGNNGSPHLPWGKSSSQKKSRLPAYPMIDADGINEIDFNRRMVAATNKEATKT